MGPGAGEGNPIDAGEFLMLSDLNQCRAMVLLPVKYSRHRSLLRMWKLRPTKLII